MLKVRLAKTPFTRRTLAIAAAGVLTVTSCAPPKVLHPPEQSLRTRLDGAGVVPVETAELANIEEPVGGAGSGAAVGARQGAVGTFAGFARAGCSGDGYSCALGLALGIVLMPVGALVGAGVGAGRAHSKEEVQAATQTIERRIAEARHAEAIADEIERIARLRGKPEFAERKPGESLQDFAERVPVSISVSIGDVGFDSSGEIDPDVRLAMAAHATVTDRKTNRDIYQQGWAYLGPWISYFALSENDGAGMQRQFDTAYRQVAKAMLNHLVYDKTPKEVPGQEARVRPLPSEFVTVEPYHMAHSAPAQTSTSAGGASTTAAEAVEAPTAAPAGDSSAAAPSDAAGYVDPLSKWDGRWTGTGAGWRISMTIEHGRISGSAWNNTNCRPCAVNGEIDAFGNVSAVMPSKHLTRRRSLAGRFPTLAVRNRVSTMSKQDVTFTAAAAN
ncbi:MAG: hypothetical protein R3316_04415 [Rhodovibrionaceae bacterium]|nr:hypothetical protein [Rhodovibrionaceae bacterium]